jgi:hypothetical protein
VDGARAAVGVNEQRTDGPSLREACALWATWGVVAALVFITYARLPARDFYNVSGSGVTGGAARVVVLLGWPISLAAIPLMAVAVDRLLGRPLTGGQRRAVITAAWVALVLCATIAWPGVIKQSNLDAKWSNGLAATGVGIAVAITVVAVRRRGMGPQRPVTTGDWVGIVLLAAMGAAALPWIFANVGVYVGDIPGLKAVFMSEKILPEPGHPHLHAVHLGNHEGLDGWLLTATALGLRRALPGMRATRLRPVLGVYLALLLGYGVMVAANDFWHEQLVKRGTTSYMLPDVITPGLAWGWGLLLVATAVMYRVGFRVPRASPSTDLPPMPEGRISL